MSAFLLVHILTPAFGVFVFLAIRRQMQLAGVANALLLPYFVIHAAAAFGLSLGYPLCLAGLIV